MGPKSKGKKSELPIARQDKDQEKTRPDWPIFKPLLPLSDLFIETLVPGQIVLIRNLWTATLCKNYVSFLSSLPLVTTPGKPKMGDAVRVNDRFQVDDELFAQRLWKETSLKQLVLGQEHVDQDAEVADAHVVEHDPHRWGGEVVRYAVHQNMQSD